MTVLLDTHAFVWAVTAPDRLSGVARDRVTDATRGLLLSSVVAWEIAIKHRAGRWPEVGVLLGQYDRVASALGTTPLPLRADHALTAGGLPWDHTDPFDRALAAQALREGVPIVTKDPAFSTLPGLTVLW